MVPPEAELVLPWAVTTSDTEPAEEVNVVPHVPVSPAPSVLVLMFGEPVVLFVTASVNGVPVSWLEFAA